MEEEYDCGTEELAFVLRTGVCANMTRDLNPNTYGPGVTLHRCSCLEDDCNKDMECACAAGQAGGAAGTGVAATAVLLVVVAVGSQGWWRG